MGGMHSGSKFAALVVLALLPAAGGCDKGTGTAGTPATAPGQDGTVRVVRSSDVPRFKAGQACVVSTDGKRPTSMTTTAADFDEMSKPGDGSATQRLMNAGRLKLVGPGTKVEVVTPGTIKTEVRVIDGPMAGTTGFVADGFLALAPAEGPSK